MIGRTIRKSAWARPAPRSRAASRRLGSIPESAAKNDSAASGRNRETSAMMTALQREQQQVDRAVDQAGRHQRAVQHPAGAEKRSPGVDPHQEARHQRGQHQHEEDTALQARSEHDPVGEHVAAEHAQHRDRRRDLQRVDDHPPGGRAADQLEIVGQCDRALRAGVDPAEERHADQGEAGQHDEADHQHHEGRQKQRPRPAPDAHAIPPPPPART